MNLLLLEAHELEGDRVHLTDERRTRHLRKVLKVEIGRKLKVGVIDGGRGTGTVTRVDADGVELRVEIAPREAPRSEIDLVMALPRPAVLHRVLQNTAAMGIGHLDLVNAWRVEKSFFQSPALAVENLRRHLILGAEQGGTTSLPTVEIHTRLVPFLRRPVPTDEVARIVAHPSTERTFESWWRDHRPSRIQLAIGPEGGWIDRELTTLAEAGFHAATLGSWILRVESAMTAAVAQLGLLRRLASP